MILIFSFVSFPSYPLQADKLIRDIRRYHKDDGKSISPERKDDEPVSLEDETVFSLNSFFQEADEGELAEQYVDDEIVFMINPVDQDEENSKCNNSAELENIEETFSKIDDHNETVEFEKHQVCIPFFISSILLSLCIKSLPCFMSPNFKDTNRFSIRLS